MIISHLYPSDEDDVPLDIDTPMNLAYASTTQQQQQQHPTFTWMSSQSREQQQKYSKHSRRAVHDTAHPMSPPQVTHPYGISCQPLRRRSNSCPGPESSSVDEDFKGQLILAPPKFPDFMVDDLRRNLRGDNKRNIRSVFRLWKRVVLVLAAYMVIMALSLKESGVNTMDVNAEKIPLLRGNVDKYDTNEKNVQLASANDTDYDTSKMGTSDIQAYVHTQQLNEVRKPIVVNEKKGDRSSSTTNTRKRSGKMVRRPNLALAKRNNVQKHTKEYKAQLEADASLLSTVSESQTSNSNAVKEGISFGGFVIIVLCSSLIVIKGTRAILISPRRRA